MWVPSSLVVSKHHLRPEAESSCCREAVNTGLLMLLSRDLLMLSDDVQDCSLVLCSEVSICDYNTKLLSHHTTSRRCKRLDRIKLRHWTSDLNSLLLRNDGSFTTGRSVGRRMQSPHKGYSRNKPPFSFSVCSNQRQPRLSESPRGARQKCAFLLHSPGSL